MSIIKTFDGIISFGIIILIIVLTISACRENNKSFDSCRIEAGASLYLEEYKIQECDTLSGIALKFKEANPEMCHLSVDIYVSQIKKTNHLKSSMIHAGSYLVIPYFK